MSIVREIKSNYRDKIYLSRVFEMKMMVVIYK